MACSVCKKQYAPPNNESSFDSNEKPHVCVTCGKSFSLKIQLKKHMEAHVDGKSYVCYACEKQNSSYNLRLSEKGTFQCETCAETFKTKRMLLQHNSSQHSTVECDECLESFENLTELKKHAVVHKSQGKRSRGVKSYHCDKCNKRYTQLQALNKHSLSHAEFACRYCQTKFPFQENLENHQENECALKNESDAGNKHDKKYTCLLCQKSFARKTALEGHIAVHVNDKSESTEEEENDEDNNFPSAEDTSCQMPADPERLRKGENEPAASNESSISKSKLGQSYPCSDCRKVYSSESLLEKHKLTHKKSKALHQHKKYRCRICREPFLSKEGYKKHKSSHGPEEKPAKRIKAYMCEVCLINFDKKKLLKNHMKTHVSKISPDKKNVPGENLKKKGSKIKPYSCRVCGRLFAGLITLKKHELNHQNQISFRAVLKKSRLPEALNCPYCEKEIPRYNFNRHKLSHTPEVCGICDERFVDRNSLREHLKSHIGSEEARKFLECSSRLQSAKQHAKPDQPEGRTEYIYLVLR